ncbi:MoaD/ThiS family protein [Geoglobus acetivorans]|uniref:MoaD/ThiS family protein n=1 Tax=Geoglobus acetivorans TaxID=565033 RepID=UPI00064F0222
MKSQKRSSQKKIKAKFIFLGGFEFREKEIEADPGVRYSELLSSLGINPETVVVIRNDEPVPIDSEIESGEVKVLRVISGG